MKNTIALNKTTIKTKTLITLAAIVSAVALPQLFHIAGAVSGIGGGATGAAFLPMQIPVILAGLLAGPVAGLLAGFLSPLVSFGISGMPVAAMLPFIILELAAYGLVAGLLGKTNSPVIFKLLLVQIVGRLVRISAVFIAVYLLGNQLGSVDSLWGFIIAGVPGILFQWALIPLILYRVKDNKYLKNNH
ncbi:MAG: ECF transporter S component [Oscillospiraceae bacterium]|nr:ECF transporter S component [Oscillospiraceae bacterium]